MKLSIERAALVKALGRVYGVVEIKATMPILSSILLRAADGKMSLVATDMDVEIVDAIAADVSKPGSCAVSAKLLNEIVKKANDGPISLELKDSNISIKSGKSSFKLGTLPATDFPELSTGTFSHSFAIEADTLATMIGRTQFCVSTEETRFYLNGIYFHAFDTDGATSMRAVATDGHRIAVIERPAPAGAEGMPPIIVPTKTVAQIKGMLSSAGSVSVSLSDIKIRFTIGETTVTSKLIDGTFPDYTRVIPTGNDKVMSVDPKVFAISVDRIAVVSSDKSRSVKLEFSANSVEVSNRDASSGSSAMEDVDVEYASEPLCVGFNSDYIKDVCRQIEGKMSWHMADAASPVVVYDSADAGAQYALMPMRV